MHEDTYLPKQLYALKSPIHRSKILSLFKTNFFFLSSKASLFYSWDNSLTLCGVTLASTDLIQAVISVLWLYFSLYWRQGILAP